MAQVVDAGGTVTGGELVPVRLSEGQAQPLLVVSAQVASGEPLSPEALAQLLARLPALDPLPGDQVDFNLAVQPIPPPRTGETVEQQFPPTDQAAPPETVDAGPLQVLRYSPEGEISVAPFVSISFNQPMVPLGTLADLAAQALPAQIEPTLPGTWRWLGTKTLTFEYEFRPDRPPAQGHGVSRHHPRGHKVGYRRRACQGSLIYFHHAAA